MKRLWLLALFFITLSAASHAEVLLVDPAHGSLTETLAAAQDGDEIILAGGIYQHPNEVFPIIVDKAVTIRAKEGENPVIASPILVAAMKITAPNVRVQGLAVDFLRSGMYVLADDVTITGCSFSLADETWRTSSCGMWIGGAKRMTLTDNRFVGCGIALAGPAIHENTGNVPVLTAMFEVGEDPAFFTTHTIENNTVNGKPLRYLVNLNGARFTEEAGQIIAANCTDITFEGMDVSGASIGLQYIYCQNVYVNHVTADHSGVFGIYAAKSEDTRIENAHADNCAHGIDIRATNRAVVANCAASDCGQGIFLSWCFDSYVSNCDMLRNGTGFFTAAGNNNHVHGCRIADNELGMYIQKEPLFTLTNCLIERNIACGARITQSGLTAWNNTFQDNFVASMALACEPVTYGANHFEGSENRALYIKNSHSVKIIGNRFLREGAPHIECVDSKEPLVEE